MDPRALDAHLEAHYEDIPGQPEEPEEEYDYDYSDHDGYADYEPSPYDGTYSEE